MKEGKGPGSNARVLRGGSWNNNPRNCRAAYRNRNDPGNRNDNYGCRVLLCLHFRSGLVRPPGITGFTEPASAAYGSPDPVPVSPASLPSAKW